jgi:NAD(P)H-dependent FMN reductase
VQSDDPTVIRSLAVHTDDVVAALEANAARNAEAVLRVTPPFNGRMRARLHLAGGEGSYDEEPRPIHVPAEALVTGEAPTYPHPDETEDALRERAGENEYTPERHREFHAEQVEAWREAVREHVAERAALPTLAGEHEVRVLTLG